MISTSPIKISCVVARRRGRDRAVRALHEAFELGADAGRGRASRSEHGAAHELPSRRRRRHRRRRHRHARQAARARVPGRARSSRSPPSAPPAASSTASASSSRCTDETIQGFDLAIFSAGGAHVRRVGAALRRRGRGRRRQLLALAPRPRGPARGRRGQPGGARRPQGPDRQPELLDDAADGRAQADPRRGRDRAADRLHLPVGVRHRREGGARSSRTRRTRCCTAWSRRRREVYPHPIAFNVLGGAGNFADGDDHTDEERKMMFETRKILGDESIGDLGHLRARAGTSLALGVGQRADARAARASSAARELLRAMPGPRRWSTTRRGTATRPRSRGRRARRGLRRAHPARPVAPARAEPVGRLRQPAQGRGDQRGPDRRGAAPEKSGPRSDNRLRKGFAARQAGITTFAKSSRGGLGYATKRGRGSGCGALFSR